MNQTVETLEKQLNDFSLETRIAALQSLLRLAQQGQIELPPAQNVANMHCHTFFSFNGYGHSPTSLAWLARKKGFKLIGIVDFDVLDAVDEFLSACDMVGVRASTGIETRVYVPQFASREINSPGEPGVAYHMGIGFTSRAVPQDVAPILESMRQRAAERNQGVLERVNAHLEPLTIDYKNDVLPLTPKGNATERHMLAAYLAAAEREIANPVAFWAGKLNLPAEQVAGLIENAPKFQDTMRGKLMKRGGVGYVQPSSHTFPTVTEFHQFVEACGALPCAAWLDGTTAGEQAMPELLGLLIDNGAVALNLIPDRNWNIADPDVKRVKLENLYQVVELAQQLDLPLNIGTEMNAYGQKLVDDFTAPELSPLHDVFMDGAYFIYGHTVAERALGLGYQSAWAKMHLPSRRQRNAFYTKLGRQVEPGPVNAAAVKQLIETMTA